MTLSNNGKDWNEPTDEDLQSIEDEEFENIIPFPDKNTIH
jgi:hypothetical protein